MEQESSHPRLFQELVDFTAMTPNQRISYLAENLEALHRRGEFNGSVLIADHGDITFERHLGVEDVDGTIPLSRHSSFSLASVSKPFTALGIMMLARRRRLTLDDLLAQHMPEFSYYEGITLRHLLHHTSGI